MTIKKGTTILYTCVNNVNDVYARIIVNKIHILS